MSELKVHNFNDFSLHDMVHCKFYLKSEADKVIAELEEERRWRKCSEEMPEEGVEVLVTNGIDCGISDWCGDYWNNDPFCGYTVCDNVIAWMPLPSAPKEEKK
jgi:hypothetical protein